MKHRDKENKEKLSKQITIEKKLEKNLSEQIINNEKYKKEIEIKLSDEKIKL